MEVCDANTWRYGPGAGTPYSVSSAIESEKWNLLCTLSTTWCLPLSLRLRIVTVSPRRCAVRTSLDAHLTGLDEDSVVEKA